MSLSVDLISQFAKITKDEEKSKTETIVYGTTVEYNGNKYVKLDGSDLLTPVTSTTSVKDGERVTVMIKNHTATITGNLTAPSASSKEVADVAEAASKIKEVEILLADKVSTDKFDAQNARIDTLVNENITITERLTASEGEIDELQTDSLQVKEDLTAAQASIAEIKTKKLDAEAANLKYATAEDLKVTNETVYNLSGTYSRFEVSITNKFAAIDATIEELDTQSLTAAEADLKYASMEEFDAIKGTVKDLTADVSDIDTLIFGSASGDVIQTSFANAVIAQLGDAQIKSAMIESMSASKIMSGDIITNHVRVMSEDGKLLISDETIQISDSTRVRVQIGKDQSGDYSINIWDQNGKLMFSEGGITDNAIKEAIIRNDMVSDTANIAAHKLDINSLFEEINGSSNTIKSTQIYLDDKKQTLDVAFKELTSEVTEHGETISSQGTAISAMQGQIESKVWQEDINAVSGSMSAQYSVLSQELDEVSATVADHTNNISGVSSQVASLEATVNSIEENVSSIDELAVHVASLQQSADGLTSRVSVVETEVASIEIGGRNLIAHSNVPITSTSPTDYGYQYVTLIPTVLPLEEGGSYAISGDIEILAGNFTSISIKLYSEDIQTQYSEVIAEIQNGHFKGVFTNVSAEAKRLLLYVGVAGSTAGNSATFSNIKFEKGNRPTDWTPAPEDMATEGDITAVESSIDLAEERISTAETLIEQLTDSIMTLVTDGNGESLMVQTEKGWTFSTGQIQDIVNTTSENLNELTNEVGNANSAISILQQAVTDLGILNDYIKIGTYEDEPCIELGEIDSDFRLLITNTRILFMEGTGVPAYISNQSLYITKAVIKEELQQGEFTWKARSNGNLGLIWKGVS